MHDHIGQPTSNVSLFREVRRHRPMFSTGMAASMIIKQQTTIVLAHATLEPEIRCRVVFFTNSRHKLFQSRLVKNSATLCKTRIKHFCVHTCMQWTKAAADLESGGLRKKKKKNSKLYVILNHKTSLKQYPKTLYGSKLWIFLLSQKSLGY